MPGAALSFPNKALALQPPEDAAAIRFYRRENGGPGKQRRGRCHPGAPSRLSSRTAATRRGLKASSFSPQVPFRKQVRGTRVIRILKPGKVSAPPRTDGRQLEGCPAPRSGSPNDTTTCNSTHMPGSRAGGTSSRRLQKAWPELQTGTEAIHANTTPRLKEKSEQLIRGRITFRVPTWANAKPGARDPGAPKPAVILHHLPRSGEVMPAPKGACSGSQGWPVQFEGRRLPGQEPPLLLKEHQPTFP